MNVATLQSEFAFSGKIYQLIKTNPLPAERHFSSATRIRCRRKNISSRKLNSASSGEAFQVCYRCPQLEKRDFAFIGIYGYKKRGKPKPPSHISS